VNTLLSTRSAARGGLAILLAAGMTHVAPVHADFPSDNVTLLSHMPASSFPGAPARGNDCWGYVSPSGREYALMGMRNALAVVDVTNPSFPTIVASVNHSESNWSDVKTYQTYAYVVNEQGGGIDVIDLANVDFGFVAHVQSVTAAGVQTSHNVAIDEDSGFLYLCGSNIENGRLVAFDLSDPANPTYAGAVPNNQGEYVHDAQIVTYTEGPHAGKQIAFGADAEFGLEIFDVTNKGNMFRLSQTAYPNLGYSHQCWLSDDRQFLYLNDEIDGVNETVIFDVTSLTNPVVVGSYGGDFGEAIDHNLYWHEGFIYEAQYTAGLLIYDATADPLNPVLVGSFDVVPGSNAAEFEGAWSVYPFFPSGNMLISTKREGLFVVRPGPPPLLLDFVNEIPPRIDPGGDSIVVSILEQDGHVLEIGSPMLHYDAGNGLVEVPMTDLGGGLYEGTFGATECGELVRFFVSARTQSNITMTNPAAAPNETYDVVSAVGSTVVLDDDLETDQGWVVGAPGDNAVTGTWIRVEPFGTTAQPEADHTNEPGELCFVTGQGNPNGGAGDADVDEGQTTLLSPVFDLAGAQDAVISYWRWYDNDFFLIDSDEGQAPNEDVFVIDISNDGGETWCNLETVGPTGPETSGGWHLAFFNVADHVVPTDEVRLRFVASDVGGFSIVEAAIDDVKVEIVACGDAGDVNGDGTVNFADVLAAIASWGACSDCPATACPADVNNDCNVNFADILVIIANWG
jgi:choice-of-anchor B domain-containing protein